MAPLGAVCPHSTPLLHIFHPLALPLLPCPSSRMPRCLAVLRGLGEQWGQGGSVGL